MRHKDELRNMPNFVVGAEKSGTTSLQQLLRSHSDIFMPEVKNYLF